MRIKETNMLEGSIVKGLLSMSIPIMIMNVCQQLFSIIDMTMLGNMVGDDAVGSVSVCGTLITLITSIIIGVSSGANVVVARHIGKRDIEGAEKAMGSAILVSICGGIILLIVGVTFAEKFLILIDCPARKLAGATTYFRLYFCALPFTLLYNFSASILRASGDAKRPMIFLLISGVIKVVLNFVFIKFFHTTVEGVGAALIIANVASSSLAFITLLRNKGKVRFRFKNLKFYKKLVGEMFYIGIPTGLQSMFYSIANVLITKVVNGYGDSATTGVGIANQYDGLMYQICIAPSLAVMPYIAQNIGAKNVKRVKQVIAKSIILTVIIGGVAGALSAGFSRQLADIMTDDPEVIMYARQKMMVVSSLYFVQGISEILVASLRALGKPIIPTISSFTFMCVFRFFWIYLIHPLWPTILFLYLVWPVGWALCISSNLCFYFPTIKKLSKKFESTNLATETLETETN